jgi:hypothetical protein
MTLRDTGGDRSAGRLSRAAADTAIIETVLVLIEGAPPR